VMASANGEDCMVYPIRLAAFATLVVIAVAATAPAIGQPVPKQQLLPGGDSETIMKERKNAWSVGLVGGVFEGSFMRFAEEIRRVVDDNDEMRVLPIVSRGTAANLEDPALPARRRRRRHPSRHLRVFPYGAKASEPRPAHPVSAALPGRRGSFDHAKRYYQHRALRGKRVQFVDTGGPSSVTGILLFQRFGIDIKLVSGPLPGDLSSFARANTTRSCAWFKSRSAS